MHTLTTPETRKIHEDGCEAAQRLEDLTENPWYGDEPTDDEIGAIQHWEDGWRIGVQILTGYMAQNRATPAEDWNAAGLDDTHEVLKAWTIFGRERWSIFLIRKRRLQQVTYRLTQVKNGSSVSRSGWIVSENLTRELFHRSVELRLEDARDTGRFRS